MSQTFLVQNGDITTDNRTGRPKTVVDIDKLRQDAFEFLTIEVQPSGFGTGLEQLIGIVSYSPETFAGVADRQVKDGLTDWIRLQNTDGRIERSAAEMVSSSSIILIVPSPSDPTLFYVRAILWSSENERVDIQQALPNI